MRVLGLLVALAALLGLTVPPAGAMDPDWVFYTSDKHRYTSPWYAGAHRIMIPFGCTEAPYYDHDPRCPGDEGFHHGLDIAIPCGTKLYAGKRAKVVDNATLGAAYGENPVLLRNRKLGWDLVIGHTRKVFVEPGDKVHRGDVFALVSDSGAPDGCHLHFEQRAVEGGLDTAVWPRPLLALRGEAMTPSQERVLRNFLDDDGRLHTIPSKHASCWSCSTGWPRSSSPARRYPESEVNDVLQRFHPDHAALRRYLVENDFLTREDGSYWRSGGTFEV